MGGKPWQQSGLQYELKRLELRVTHVSALTVKLLSL